MGSSTHGRDSLISMRDVNSGKEYKNYGVRGWRRVFRINMCVHEKQYILGLYVVRGLLLYYTFGIGASIRNLEPE